MPPRKRAIVFAGTDGHGVTMGVISQRNLQAAGYDTVLDCRWPQTGMPSQFWGETFLLADYAGVDLVVVVDTPLPEDDGTFPNAVRDALAKIGELEALGTRVVIVDHHKAAETHYGAARLLGAEIVISSSATSCFWGDPSPFANTWGRLGAVCDLDDSVLPVSDEEERIALGIDTAVRRDLATAIDAIGRDDVEHFRQIGELPQPPGATTVVGNVAYIAQLTPTWGFKQLSRAATVGGVDYAVGRDVFNTRHRVIAVTSWKRDALPVALKLGLTHFIGHGSAILVPVAPDTDPTGAAQTEARALEFVARLNSTELVATGEKNGNGHGADSLFKYVSAFMRKVRIPFFLTQHGWPHVQRVIANGRTLGSLFNLPEPDLRILDWVGLFHDVGNGADTYYPTLGLSDQDARARHHEFSAQMIREWHAQGLFAGILTDAEVEMVADLSFRHRKNELH